MIKSEFESYTIAVYLDNFLIGCADYEEKSSYSESDKPVERNQTVSAYTCSPAEQQGVVEQRHDLRYSIT